MDKNMMKEYIREVTPAIDMDGWQPECPNCSGSIKVEEDSYFLFAQKHWCYGTCESCQKRFLLDVPTLLYNFLLPQILDVGTGKIYGKAGFWQRDTVDIYFQLVEPKADVTIEEPEKPKGVGNLLEKIKQNIDLLKRGDRAIVYNKVQKLLASKSHKAADAPKQAKPSLKITIKNGSESDPILLFNCLDEYYVHSTRFIQFTHIICDEIGDILRKQGIATAILLPESLQFYVPDFIDQVWIATHLPTPFGRGTFRDVEFNRQLNEEIRKRQIFIPKKKPNLSVGVNARRYFHLDVVERETQLSLEQYSPIFVLYSREDYRSWGGHPQKELKNYSRLANLLKRSYPSAGIYMVGMTRNYPIKNSHIIDLRTNGIPESYRTEKIDYLYLLSKTDCAIGVHGSNMAEMTALAKSVVTLQPRYRYINYSDDMFLIKSSSFVADYCRFYSLFGKTETLSDVAPEQVRALIEAALLNRNKYLYLMGDN